VQISLNKYRHGKTTSQKNKIRPYNGLLIFILATYLIGDKQNMFGKTSDLEAVFTNEWFTVR
jgi:phospholipid/cholesterol/gamma-HCH transport system substrate-binding protein